MENTNWKTAIESLNTSDEEIAKRFQELGITGDRYSGLTCPIANFVRSQIPVELRSNGYNYVCATPNYIYVGSDSAELPKPAKQFILAFDAGEFPQLITKN